MTSAVAFPNTIADDIVIRPAIRRIPWTLTAAIFLLPVQIPFGATRWAPSDLCVILFALLHLPRLRLVKGAWSIFHWGLLLAFLIGTTITAIRDAHLNTYVVMNKDLGILLLYLSYAALTSAAENWESVRQMLRTFIFACLVHSALAVAVFLIAKVTGQNYLPWMNYDGNRVAGMLVDPNAFGGLIAAALVIHATTLFSESPLIAGIRGYLVLSILALGLLLTLSRSAWIGLGLSFLFTAFFRPRVAAGLVGAAVIAGLALVLLAGWDRGSAIMALADRPNTAYQRLAQIEEAIPMISAHPLFGSGLGSFLQDHGWIIHNTTVWILTEFGVFGLIVYAGLILWYLARGILTWLRTSNYTGPLVLGLLCAHLCMLGVSVGIEAFYQRHWWFVMALLASSYTFVAKTES